MTVTQLTLIIFLSFAITRVWLRFRSGSLSRFALLFWSSIFLVGIIITLHPGITTQIAKELGVGRGVDAVIYCSIVLLFYLVFRLHILLEDVRHEITDLVSRMAVKDYEKKP